MINCAGAGPLRLQWVNLTVPRLQGLRVTQRFRHDGGGMIKNIQAALLMLMTPLAPRIAIAGPLDADDREM